MVTMKFRFQGAVESALHTQFTKSLLDNYETWRDPQPIIYVTAGNRLHSVGFKSNLDSVQQAFRNLKG